MSNLEEQVIEISAAENAFADLLEAVTEYSVVSVAQYTDEFLALISDDDMDDKFLYPWLSSKTPEERTLLLQGCHRAAIANDKISVKENSQIEIGAEIELLARLRSAPTISRTIYEQKDVEPGWYMMLHYWHGENFVFQEIVRPDGLHDFVACTAQRAMEMLMLGLEPSGNLVETDVFEFVGTRDEFNLRRDNLLEESQRSAFFTLNREDVNTLSQFEVVAGPRGYFVLRSGEKDFEFVIESMPLDELAAALIFHWFDGEISTKDEL
jgi:hypothetical protein